MNALAKNISSVNPASPADLAREAIRQMAVSRVAPTPENFARAYRAASGGDDQSDVSESEQVLGELVSNINARCPDLGSAIRLQEHVKNRAWNDAQKILREVINEALTETSRVWPRLLQHLLLQLDTTHANWTRARKLIALKHVLAAPSNDDRTREKLERLIGSWSAKSEENTSGVPVAVSPPVNTDGENDGSAPLRAAVCATEHAAPVSTADHTATANAWRKLALNALDFNHSEDSGGPIALDKPGTLGLEIRAAECDGLPGAELLRELDFVCSSKRVEMHRQAALRDRLSKLLRLVCENLTLFADDDAWVNGQVKRITQLLNAPLDEAALTEAEESMQRAVKRQSELKADLTQAKAVVKDMLASLIERLAAATMSTGEFHRRISVRAEAIKRADDLPSITLVVANLLDDTIEMRDRMQQTHDELSAARRIAEESALRVKTLEQELVDVSDLVRMDPLTQVLNRRGLAETFATQRSRAEREGKPLAVALLDIDNFKCLNDALGHQAGDMALKYISSMVRAAVRPSDTVARYGGEEFVILLDDTSAAGAEVVLKRLQRQLTRAIFLHNDEKVLITFSAGITEFIHGDSQDSVTGRADVALYAAKAAGKNCVRTG